MPSSGSSGSVCPDSGTIAWSSFARHLAPASYPRSPTERRRDRALEPPTALLPSPPCIAVLSDIHGNLPALEAVLAALSPYDAVWQLGDVVGYGPEPDAVVARLRELGATGVRGNHDAAALGELSTAIFNSEARAAVLWTASIIRPETRDWLSALPETAIEGEFTLAHGSPRDPLWEYVLTTPTARFPHVCPLRPSSTIA